MSARRDFLGFTAGAVVALSILPAGGAWTAERDRPMTLFPPGNNPRFDPHPDLGLLLVVERHAEIEAAAEAEHDDDARGVILDQSLALVDEMAAIPATTMQGVRAKAQGILKWDRGDRYTGSPNDDPGDRLIASLLRDLVGDVARPFGEGAA